MNHSYFLESDMSLMEAPERNLAFDLVRVTEAAALASARWLGRGDKNAGDGAAVDAMRLSFNSLPIAGKVVIGEGEKDEAPMLYNGEIIGMGNGPSLDIAVDPVEGTNLLAYGRPNAIAVVGAAPGGSMYNPGPSFYMQKLVVGQAARDVIDLDAASSPRRWARIPTTSWSSSSISPAIKSSFRKSGPWARASSCIPTATSPVP